MARYPDHSGSRRCPCRGVNPTCPQCGGRGVIDLPGLRGIMAGPTPVRRRLPIPLLATAAPTSPGPPEPKRCPHCHLDVLDLPAHVAESHPEQAQAESAADQAAREEEAARQARVAAELARREAEAAQRKAEARARRQAIEGREAPDPLRGSEPPAPGSSMPGFPSGAPHALGDGPRIHGPARPVDDTWERLRRALTAQTIVRGVVRSCQPFGVFVDVGGIDGLVRTRETAGPVRFGQTVAVRVIGMDETTQRVELSLRRAPHHAATRGSEPPAAKSGQPEGALALAFRLAQEKKQHSG